MAPLPGWQDTLLQLCEKQVRMINVPNYSQNNGTLSAQSSGFSFINNLYLPSTSQIDVKQEPDIQPKEEKNLNKVRYFLKIKFFYYFYITY